MVTYYYPGSWVFIALSERKQDKYLTYICGRKWFEPLTANVPLLVCGLIWGNYGEKEYWPYKG